MELNMVNSNINEVNKHSEYFSKMVGNVIDKGSDYLLKAVPVPEGVRDILSDIKDCLISKDYSDILKTAVNSAVREGAEFLGIEIKDIKDFNKLKEVSLKGGLRENLTSTVDIASNKYTKNNLLSKDIDMYVNDVKDFINSKDFIQKINNNVNLVSNKQKSVDELFKKWDTSYLNLDVKGLNTTLKDISNNKEIFTDEMNDKFRVIKNITEFVNNTNSKLSNLQMEVCKSI